MFLNAFLNIMGGSQMSKNPKIFYARKEYCLSIIFMTFTLTGESFDAY